MPDIVHVLTISAGGFDAHATCVVGQTQGAITYLTYVSLLGPGTTVVAIWANLMDHRTTVVTLEGVGNVQLWNRQPAFAELGYRLSWHRRHRVLHLDHGTRVVHLVTEPDLLTVRDPLLADATTRSRRGNGGHGRGGEHVNHRQRRRHGTGDPIEAGGTGVQDTPDAREAASGDGRRPSSANNQATPTKQGAGAERSAAEAAMEQVNEQVARETRPLFVLLGRRGEDAHALACRHLLFLAERVQWLAYYEPWAEFFWRRGLRTGEITPLSVWPTSDASGASDALEVLGARALANGPDEPNAAPTGTRWITGSYLCQPNPFALAEALPEVIRAQLVEDASSTGAAHTAHPAKVSEHASETSPLPFVPPSLPAKGGIGK